MAKLFNRAKMTTTTTGSGTITLGSASNGFQSFADAGVADGDVVQYVIEEGANFEIGTGTYSATGTSLTRTPSESSNSNNAITLAGQATVSITAVADDLNRLQHNGTDKVTVSSTGASVSGNLAVSGTVDGVDVSARDAVLTSTTTTANAALPKAGGTVTGDLSLDGWVYHDVAGQNFVLRSDTSNRNTFEWQQGTTRIWTLDLQADGDLNFVDAQGGNTLRVGNSRIFADNYHPNADKWTTSRTLSLTGGVTGSVSWDGSANASLTSTVALATASAVGGIKIGYSENGKNYPVELDGSGKAYVNVPWTDTNTDTNTTYSLKAQQTGGNNTNPNLLLDANSGTDDTVQLVGSGATTVTRNSDGQITISSTDTNTNTNQLTTFQLEDGDGTEVTIGHGKEVKFVEGGGIDINWTDTSHGSDGDPYDLTFTHADTSSQASVNNSNGTVIQDVTLDGYGHVTGLASVNLDGRYYTESEINTFINRSYVSKHSATNLATGWYTIAQNTGDRAVARFALWDTNSSDHQAVIFYASHHFGTDASNTLTVLDNSYFSGNPFRYIRIKDAGTYDGAALQVYIDDASNSVNIAIVGDDVQSSGWDIVDFLGDATAPSQVSNWSNFGERSKIDLNQIAQGGLATTGPIYADGDTTQYRVFNDNYHPNADKWTTARTLSLSGDASGSVSWDGSANATLSVTVANDSHTHDGRYYTESEADGRFLRSNNDDQMDGTLTIQSGGANSYGRIRGYPNDNHFIVIRGSVQTGTSILNITGAHRTTFVEHAENNDSTGWYFVSKQTGSYQEIARITRTGGMHLQGNKVWHAGNDGSGSGLDADTVDGVHETTFMRKSANSHLDMNGYNINDADSFHTQAESKDVKFAVYSGSTYGIGMTSGITYGALNDWAMTFCMNNDTDRGFWWGYSGQTKSTGAMSLTTNGRLTVSNYVSSPNMYIDSAIYHNGDTNTYMQFHAADQWRVVTGGTERLEVNNSHVFVNNDFIVRDDAGIYVQTDTNGAGAKIKMSDRTTAYEQNGTIEYLHQDGSSYGSGNAFKFYGTESTMSFHVTGHGYFTGNVATAYSDERLKDFDGKIEGALDKLSQLNGYYYHANDTAAELGYDKEPRQVGVSAQEVEAVMPEVIAPAAIDPEYKTVHYDRLVPLLIEAIKEQQTQIDALTAQVEELKRQ